MAESQRDRLVWVLQEKVTDAGREQRLTCTIDPSSLAYVCMCMCMGVGMCACVCVYPRCNYTDRVRRRCFWNLHRAWLFENVLTLRASV